MVKYLNSRICLVITITRQWVIRRRYCVLFLVVKKNSVLQSAQSVWGPASYLFKGYFVLFPQDYSGRILKMTSHLEQFSRLTLSGGITAVAHVPFGLYVDSFNLLVPTKFSTKFRNLLWHFLHTRLFSDSIYIVRASNPQRQVIFVILNSLLLNAPVTV
jgi:hypothetical protein